MAIEWLRTTGAVTAAPRRWPLATTWTVLIAAVPPLMVKAEKNPDGTPIEVFDSFRKALAENRAQFFLDVASGPFYGFNRPGAKASQGIIQNWWHQGMTGSALAYYEGIKAFSETDQTDDLKAISVPTLVLHGDDDEVVPYKDASVLQAKLLKHGTLKIYPGFPHGMMTTNADVINADIPRIHQRGDSQIKNRGRKLASLRAAIVTACGRSRAPSFSGMCFICAFTVSSEMKRRSAISRFRFPVAFPLLHPIVTPITVS
jgi:hypothetical protein